jgi:gamma-glutamyltranspeptidase/glutathione hydrolase
MAAAHLDQQRTAGFPEHDLSYRSERPPIFGRQVVATSHSLASQAGLRVLEAGGNAVDAAIAAAATLTIVEPTMNGLGGDVFALVWDGAELHGLNASGRSPRAWTPDRFSGRRAMPELGWDAVTVPGGVSGWTALHRRFATRSLTELFRSARAYAADGFPVTPQVAALWAVAPARYGAFAEFRRVFLPDGRPPSVGSWVKLPDAGATLGEIAETEGASFYTGRLARAIAASARAEGGVLTEEDLAAHRAEWVEPLSVDYAGIRLHELPPNGQGLATLLALAILKELDVRGGPDEVDTVHFQLEAMKAAFAVCGRHLADPDAMRATADELLDPRAVSALAGAIRRDRAAPSAPLPPADHGTVYVSTADAAGRMVSLIQSNYLGFGSGVVVPSTGIALHNRGLGFRLDPRHPSSVAGGKRPYHTIMPGFVTRGGKAEMAFGVMGGHMQPQGHVQVVARSFAHGQNPQTVCDAPRWHVTEASEVALEPGFGAELPRELARRGHRLTDDAPTLLFGGAQVLRRLSNGVYCAGSDPRKDGQAVGS